MPRCPFRCPEPSGTAKDEFGNGFGGVSVLFVLGESGGGVGSVFAYQADEREAEWEAKLASRKAELEAGEAYAVGVSTSDIANASSGFASGELRC